MTYLKKALDYVTPLEKELEREIRFCIDKRAFDNSPASIAKHLCSNVDQTINYAKELIERELQQGKPTTLEETMRFIYTTGTESMIVNERFFVNGQQDTSKQKSFKKSKVIHPIYGVSRAYPIAIPYKITFSREEPYPSINLNDFMANAQNLRIRVRLSVVINPDWRLDITLTKALGTTYVRNLSTIQPFRSKMFVQGLTAANFIDLAPWTEADTIEVETEYVGQATAITEKDLAFPINYVLKGLHGPETLKAFEYQIALWKLAKSLGRSDISKYQPPCARFGLKQLSTSVVGLTKLNWYSTVKRNVLDGLMSVSDKPDGTRCLVQMYAPIADNYSGKGNTTCKLLTFNVATHKLLVPITENMDNDANLLVLDAELMDKQLLVFDVLIINGENISKSTYRDRRSNIRQICKVLNTYSTENELSFVEKRVEELDDSNYREVLPQMASSVESKYFNEGLVFTPTMEPYTTTIYKWKDARTHGTIDFLIMKAPKNLTGIPPYINKPNEILYILFCGMRRDLFNMFGPPIIHRYTDFFGPNMDYNSQYMPVQFSPSDKPYAHIFWSSDANLNGKVGEFLYGLKDQEWKLIRLRTDRDVEIKRGTYFGNDMRIAEENWRAYHNPLTIEEMVSGNAPYFAEESTEESNTLRRYNSKVRAYLLGRLQKSKWMVDLGAGKGQALKAAYISGTESCLFVDKDVTALDELINRKYEFTTHFNVNGVSRPHHMNIYTMSADLTKDDVNVLAKQAGIPLADEGANIVYSGFMIHYLCGSRENISWFAALVGGLLASGGTLIITCLNGQKIYNDLSKAEVICKQSLMCIRSRYSGKFADAGQKIEVRLPFSGEQFYEEYLVNIDYVSKCLKGYSIEIVERGGFLDLEQALRTTNNDIDRKFLNYHEFLVFRKK